MPRWLLGSSVPDWAAPCPHYVALSIGLVYQSLSTLADTMVSGQRAPFPEVRRTRGSERANMTLWDLGSGRDLPPLPHVDLEAFVKTFRGEA